MRKRFVAIGECMIEAAPADGGLYALGFAGDTFNTAWYARRALPADWTVGYVTAVGTDAPSDRMLRFMAGAGLDVGHVTRIAARTVGLYLIELDRGERSFVYWRDRSAARLLADDPARLAAGLEGAGLIYVSGITFGILDDAGRATLRAALAAARAGGAVVAFDPNLRPRLFPDAATLRRVATEAAGTADVVLPSFEDEATHFGDATPAATAARYAGVGARLVVVKDGSRDVLVREGARDAAVRVPPAAEVLDTTAAGDSFNAAFLAAWLGGAAPVAAAEAGAALARRVIARRGALVEVGEA